MIFKVSLFVVSHSGSLNISALTVPSNYLGTGHYLLPGGRRILGGITWFLEEQKAGSVVTENPKEGIIENFGRIQKGTTQICLGNEDMGGPLKSSNVIRGGITSVKYHLKGGSAKFYIV